MQRAAIVVLFALANLCQAGGVTGRGGLEAVAVTPDGKRVAVGGQNRVVYLVDAGTLAVTRRIWLGARVGGLAFTHDGARLVVEEEEDRLHLLDSVTGKGIRTVQDVRGLVVRTAANLVIVHDRADLTRHRLRLLALDTLQDRGRIDLPGAPVVWSFSADGKQLAVLGASEPGEEKRVPLTEVPRELTGLARWTFRLKHDGQQARLWVYDVATGKLAREQRLWYTSDSDSTVLVHGPTLSSILNRNNLCARIAQDGKIELFETSLRVNTGLGASADGKVLVTGGLGEGTHGTLDGSKVVKFVVPPLPGQSESFNRFVVQPDGSAWGVTTAYRLMRITATGKLDKVAPVY